ncbi:unnamed protein product, partial [Mesorhabditis belari]|uniref:Uncharacterized protein n=1 Tax=Mesorhabditis belari TaxID=2138241 RepID=A0AAF3EEB9_9BILA
MFIVFGLIVMAYGQEKIVATGMMKQSPNSGAKQHNDETIQMMHDAQEESIQKSNFSISSWQDLMKERVENHFKEDTQGGDNSTSH